jgi:S-adenosylmethionine synthetase
MAGQNYRHIDYKRDQIVTDADTGAILGIRNDQDQTMLNGVTDYMSGMGGSLTTIAGRKIIIPQYSQVISHGGVTISSGSLTAIGELIAVTFGD